ncbi:MAG: cellulase family glycosylhydrolase [Ardenticatenaceae bacterium]|nr:cellulase family glycosylhydrolase [Anaerolineales bacterium]MCB8922566.1 cellulase family glycosylhydrolase [Ardenticatenaceae bacterium]MCB8991234.1 cellulase family glycosylhydrolase [Ardenticatenaceae bacterium]MCB9003725.1 cellulase family glycosylhydrolase [Ardenticatenaceae bacterium]
MQQIWKLIVGLAVLGLVVALCPPTTSLYDLTGEEEWPGQLLGVGHWLNTAVRPQPLLAPDKVTKGAGLFGVNTFLQQEAEPAKRELSMQLISAAGFQFIRQEFPWEDIEIHGKGDFVDRRNDLDGDGVADEVDAWAKYDQIVDLAEQYDVQILARLDNPPAWTRVLTDTIGTYAPPDDYADFGDFVTAVAQRYQHRITYYQIWNEPNGNLEWGNPDLSPVNPEAYTELLCLAYQRIKAVDPQAVVLAGALTPTIEVSGRNLNDLIFLQRMYAAGAGDCFDIMSAQGYGLFSGPTDQRLRPTVINYPHHLLIRDVMVRNGDAAKPIWVSEMAWNAAPEPLPASYGRVTETQQAAYAVEAYQRAAADWPWIGVVNYWFFKRAADWEKDQSWYYFRLMEPDFTPLPAWDALAAYASANPVVMAMPRWVGVWMRVRPFLFLPSLAILFYALLRRLAPREIGD